MRSTFPLPPLLAELNGYLDVGDDRQNRADCGPASPSPIRL
jgi:hypothetical protein